MSEHVGQVIKSLREERKLSKSRLARESGFSDAYLVQIEKGDRRPSDSVLRALARALRVPPHKLLIPAGYYTPEELRGAYYELAQAIDTAEEKRGPLSDADKDRLLALALEVVEEARSREEYYKDDKAHEASYRQYQRHEDPLAMTPEEFWDWDVATSWAPEHWNSLTTRDRKLVQQLINRLVQLADEG